MKFRKVMGAAATATAVAAASVALTGIAHADYIIPSTQTGHGWGIYGDYHYDTNPNTKIGAPDGYYPDGLSAGCFVSDSDSYVGGVGNVWYRISWVYYSTDRGWGSGWQYVGTAYVFGGYFDGFNAFYSRTLSRCTS